MTPSPEQRIAVAREIARDIVADGLDPDLPLRMAMRKIAELAALEAFARFEASLALLPAREGVIEECARVVEQMPPRILEFWDRPGGPPGNGYRDLRQADCAAAIRALSSAHSTGDL